LTEEAAKDEAAQ